MSWLFDRLCELAGADQVEVVIAADTSAAFPPDDSSEFADLLLRASQIPQLAVWVVPSQPTDRSCAERCDSVELDVLGVDEARLAIRSLLARQQDNDGASLHVECETVRMNPTHVGNDVFAALSADAPPGLRRLFATDRAGHADLFRHLGSSGLGVSIGGVDPHAAVEVPNLIGLTSIVDALVTLRYLAFGVTERHRVVQG